METFRDLYIRGSNEQLAAAMSEIEQSLPDDWIRDTQAESRLRTMALNAKPTFCFSSTEDDPLPAAAIFIFEKTPGTYYVSNIVPRTKDRLSYGEYNAIVEFFCDHLVRPAAAKHGATVELTTDQEDLNTNLSAATAKKLRSFSMMANKSTGSAHPLDSQRWISFITAAHREGSSLDASTLRRWLIEVEKWPAETADQLAAEYEFSRELLTHYDGEGEGA